METFSTLLVLCEGNSPVFGEFPSQRPVTRSFDVFFDLRLNKRMSKQSWGWWFETLSSTLWRHCNGVCTVMTLKNWVIHRTSAKLLLRPVQIKLSASMHRAVIRLAAKSREVSRPRDWMLQWSYLSEIWQMLSGRWEKTKPESLGFETLRDLAVRHPPA